MIAPAAPRERDTPKPAIRRSPLSSCSTEYPVNESQQRHDILDIQINEKPSIFESELP